MILLDIPKNHKILEQGREKRPNFGQLLRIAYEFSASLVRPESPNLLQSIIAERIWSMFPKWRTLEISAIHP